MSSMLEQAIIDAEALREAALKSAQQQIEEKYSSEIKEAMKVLLEEPGDELDLGDAPAEEGAQKLTLVLTHPCQQKMENHSVHAQTKMSLL